MNKTLAPSKPLMHETHIDIDPVHREKLVALLNNALAHLIDLKLQVKQAHWNVKGMRFIALHQLFDELATELDMHIDMTAERATTLGGVAQGTLRMVYDASTLHDYPLTAVSGEEHLEILIDRYAHVTKLVREYIDEAEETLNDRATADLFTELTRKLDLRLWFLEAHVQSALFTTPSSR